MAKKKKQQTDISIIDTDALLEETVIASRLGRAIASLGGILTGTEKHNGELLYQTIRAGKIPSQKLLVTAEIVEETETKKYSPTEIIDWYVANFPKNAGPILARKQEQYTKPKTLVRYGLKEGKDFDDQRYIDALITKGGIEPSEAKALYTRVLKPILERQEEESRLASLTMKD